MTVNYFCWDKVIPYLTQHRFTGALFVQLDYKQYLEEHDHHIDGDLHSFFRCLQYHTFSKIGIDVTCNWFHPEEWPIFQIPRLALLRIQRFDYFGIPKQHLFLFDWTNVQPEEFESLLNNAPDLETLHISLRWTTKHSFFPDSYSEEVEKLTANLIDDNFLCALVLRLPELTVLRLEHTFLTSTGLRYLSNLSHLRALQLHWKVDPNARDSTFAKSFFRLVASLPQLTRLSFIPTFASLEGIEQLTQLKYLWMPRFFTFHTQAEFGWISSLLRARICPDYEIINDKLQ
jgi:hypothetical protein